LDQSQVVQVDSLVIQMVDMVEMVVEHSHSKALLHPVVAVAAVAAEHQVVVVMLAPQETLVTQVQAETVQQVVTQVVLLLTHGQDSLDQLVQVATPVLQVAQDQVQHQATLVVQHQPTGQARLVLPEVLDQQVQMETQELVVELVMTDHQVVLVVLVELAHLETRQQMF